MMERVGGGPEADRLAAVAVAEPLVLDSEDGSFWTEVTPSSLVIGKSGWGQCRQLDWERPGVCAVLALRRGAHGTLLEPWLRRSVALLPSPLPSRPPPLSPPLHRRLIPLSALRSFELSPGAEVLLFGADTASLLGGLALTHAAVLGALRREEHARGVVEVSRVGEPSPRWSREWQAGGRAALMTELFCLFSAAAGTRFAHRVAAGLHVVLDEAVCDGAGEEVVRWLDRCLGCSENPPWAAVSGDGEWLLPHPVSCPTLLLAVLSSELCRRGRSLVSSVDRVDGSCLGGLVVGLMSRYGSLLEIDSADESMTLHRAALEACATLAIGCMTGEQVQLFSPRCVRSSPTTKEMLGSLVTTAECEMS